MDHCFTCRRALDGALVCPGCGAYAPDIDPRGPIAKARTARRSEDPEKPPEAAGSEAEPADGDGPVPLESAPEEAETPVVAAADDDAGGPADPVSGAAETDDADETDDAGQADEAREADETPSGAGDPVVGPEPADAPTPHDGPTGRRFQSTRWKMNRRRAAAATVVAFLGGGLTLAAVSPSSSKAPASVPAPDTAASPSPRTATGTLPRPTRGGAVSSSRTASTPGLSAPADGAATVPWAPGSAPATASSGSVGPRPQRPAQPPTTGRGGSSAPPTRTSPPATSSPSPSHVCLLTLCLP